MKTISKFFMVCLLALSSITAQASSSKPTASSLLPAIMLPTTPRNRQVAPLLVQSANHAQVEPADKIPARVTPATVRLTTPSPVQVSPVPFTPDRIATPRLNTVQLAPISTEELLFTREYVDKLLNANENLTMKNKQISDSLGNFHRRSRQQITTIVQQENKIKEQDQLITIQQDQLSQQHNMIVGLKIQLAESAARSSLAAKINKTTK